MTSEVSPGKTDGGFLRLLRTAAYIAALIGAIGSVGFTLRAGHRNPSRLLITLFVLWVLSPFIAMLFGNFMFKRWPALIRAALHTVVLILSLVSLAIYGQVALGPPRAKTAFVFVVVPPLSWLLMAIAVSAAALISRRRSRARGA